MVSKYTKDIYEEQMVSVDTIVYQYHLLKLFKLFFAVRLIIIELND